MATAAAIAGLIGKTPSDAALGFAVDWFRIAAEAGHAANATVDFRHMIDQVGVIRVSKYGKALSPYAEVLRIAGELKAKQK